eukprot:PhM_4_TR14681/c2_g1_i1/m.16617
MLISVEFRSGQDFTSNSGLCPCLYALYGFVFCLILRAHHPPLRTERRRKSQDSVRHFVHTGALGAHLRRRLQHAHTELSARRHSHQRTSRTWRAHSAAQRCIAARNLRFRTDPTGLHDGIAVVQSHLRAQARQPPQRRLALATCACEPEPRDAAQPRHSHIAVHTHGRAGVVQPMLPTVCLQTCGVRLSRCQRTLEHRRLGNGHPEQRLDGRVPQPQLPRARHIHIPRNGDVAMERHPQLHRERAFLHHRALVAADCPPCRQPHRPRRHALYAHLRLHRPRQQQHCVWYGRAAQHARHVDVCGQMPVGGAQRARQCQRDDHQRGCHRIPNIAPNADRRHIPSPGNARTSRRRRCHRPHHGRERNEHHPHRPRRRSRRAHHVASAHIPLKRARRAHRSTARRDTVHVHVDLRAAVCPQHLLTSGVARRHHDTAGAGAASRRALAGPNVHLRCVRHGQIHSHFRQQQLRRAHTWPTEWWPSGLQHRITDIVRQARADGSWLAAVYTRCCPSAVPLLVGR